MEKLSIPLFHVKRFCPAFYEALSKKISGNMEKLNLLQF